MRHSKESVPLKCHVLDRKRMESLHKANIVPLSCKMHTEREKPRCSTVGENLGHWQIGSSEVGDQILPLLVCNTVIEWYCFL